MTPQERQLVTELFDRLAKLENEKREPGAERAIAEGLKRAPNSVYALVQTLLLQDQALRDADTRIRDLQADLEAGPRANSFLDDMRGALFGRPQELHGSVPSVDPAAPYWRGGGFQAPPQERAPERGSFLGHAAAAAAGVIGGALLLDGIRSAMSGGRHAGWSDPAIAGGPQEPAPWGGGAPSGDLARDAGIDDIGRGERASLLDPAKGNADDDLDGDLDLGGGDSDFA